MAAVDSKHMLIWLCVVIVLLSDDNIRAKHTNVGTNYCLILLYAFVCHHLTKTFPTARLSKKSLKTIKSCNYCQKRSYGIQLTYVTDLQRIFQVTISYSQALTACDVYSETHHYYHYTESFMADYV